MKKEEYLERLRSLLFSTLEKDDAENAYSYYSELFEEDDADAIIKRIGSPEDVVKTFLKADDEITLLPSPHRIRSGFRGLFKEMGKKGSRKITASLYFILILLILTLEAFLILNSSVYLVIDISIGLAALSFILSDLTKLSLLILLTMLTLRHLPYFFTERRR